LQIIKFEELNFTDKMKYNDHEQGKPIGPENVNLSSGIVQ